MPNIAAFSGGRGPKWNMATGGSISDIANYNGSGEKWRVHTFTSGSNFVVTQSIRPFRVLITGGGGGMGGGKDGGTGPGPSASAYNTRYDSATVPAGTHAVSIGLGGGGVPRAGCGSPSVGGTGGTSSLGALWSAAGGGGGGNQGHCGYNYCGCEYTGPGGSSFNSDITGTSLSYCSTGSGRPGSGVTSENTAGVNGIIIISYRIG